MLQLRSAIRRGVKGRASDLRSQSTRDLRYVLKGRRVQRVVECLILNLSLHAGPITLSWPNLLPGWDLALQDTFESLGVPTLHEPVRLGQRPML